MLEQLCHLCSAITKEGKWQSTMFYDSLGTEPSSALCTSNSVLKTKEAAIGSLSFPFQGFIVSHHTKGRIRHKWEHLHQYHMNLSNAKLITTNEINILFLTQLSRGKNYGYCQIPLRCVKITQVGCKGAKITHYTKRNEEKWGHFWARIMLDFCSS